MVRKPVVTSTLKWESRADAELSCQAILRGGRYGVGEVISEPEDIAVLNAILEIHPHAADKIGAGVKHFIIKQQVGTSGVMVSGDSVGFWITRVDESEIDFSYVEAIYPSDQKKQVTTALRADVDDLRKKYRDERFTTTPVVSDLSSQEFAKRADATVIYENPSFSQLAYQFARREGGWDAIEVVKGNRNPFIGDQLADPDVLARWREFYTKHARPLLATKSEGAKRPKPNETDWDPGL